MKKSLALIAAATLAASSLLSGCAAVVVTGVGAAALSIDDRRSAGTQIDDESLELKIESRIHERYGRPSDVHVNAVSFNRIVLLVGEAPSDAVKAEIEQLARGVPNVRNVQNEIVVGPVSSLTSRGNDALITSKVKARMVDAQRFNPNHVKVYTEAGAVFLMGLVNAREAEDAAQVASTTSGVNRVVKVFEYMVN